MTDRTDPAGRAFAGSQRQIQTYVNLHPDALNAAILRAFPELGKASVELEWVSPLEKDGFAEYRDEAFLAALGRSDLAAALAAFWPRGGPQWDALASVRRRDQPSLESDDFAKSLIRCPPRRGQELSIGDGVLRLSGGWELQSLDREVPCGSEGVVRCRPG